MGDEWTDVPAGDVDAWNGRLLATDASLHQYPYWNEPYRRLHWKPHYLTFGGGAETAAFACVLTLGLPPLRIGLVHRGPVWLEPSSASSIEPIAGLLRWAERSRIAFLRFTHTDSALLDAVARVGPAERIDSFPFHRGDPARDLVVPLPESGADLITAFRKDARREIRRDLRKSYEVRSTDAPKALAAIWPMFTAHARRRGFRHFRPMSWWLDVMQHAKDYGLARLYVASRQGIPIAADLYLRDRISVRSITAWDEPALEGDPSPSTFLAWHAMNDLRRIGIREFTLGHSGGTLRMYKERFQPREQLYPAPVTLIATETSYRLWRATALSVRGGWRSVRRMLQRI